MRGCFEPIARCSSTAIAPTTITDTINPTPNANEKRDVKWEGSVLVDLLLIFPFSALPLFCMPMPFEDDVGGDVVGDDVVGDSVGEDVAGKQNTRVYPALERRNVSHVPKATVKPSSERATDIAWFSRYVGSPSMTEPR